MIKPSVAYRNLREEAVKETGRNAGWRLRARIAGSSLSSSEEEIFGDLVDQRSGT
jgi:hypothetical protein